MAAQVSELSRARFEHEWPTPLSPKELDRRFPGVLDTSMVMSAAANIIMQLALPAVGYGVVESRVPSGSILHNPLKRTRTTFTYMAVAMMGTTEEKLAYRRAVNGVHAQVHSTDASPVQYNALDPELQLWVAACLYWGFLDTLQKLHGPMTRQEQEAFYQFTHPLGTTLQVNQDMWPQDLEAFEEYWQNGLDKLHIDEPVHEYLMALADLRFLNRVSQFLFGRFHRFITTGFLPETLREKMQLEWNDQQQRRFDRTVILIGKVIHILPRPLRQLAYTLPLRDFRQRRANNKPLV